MFILEIALCSGEIGQIQVTGTLKETHQGWAKFADRLLMGQDLKVDIPGAKKGSHPVSVSLYEISELVGGSKPRLETMVYRSCIDLHPPQPQAPKLYIPTGASV